MSLVGCSGVAYETDKFGLQFGHAYEFLLKDGVVIRGGAYDSGVISGAMFGPSRQDICWSRVAGFRSID